MDNVVIEGQEEPGQTPSPASQADLAGETPSPEGTPSEETAPEGVQPEGGEPEEPSVEESKGLSDRTQKRIRTLIGERNEEVGKRKTAQKRIQELEGLITSGGHATPLPKTETAQKALEHDPQLRTAVERLKEMGGFVTKKELQSYQDRVYLENSHDRMKTKYPGDKDMPSYDPVEVEDHMRRTGVYNPEVAYLNLYDKERIQKAKKEALTQTEAPFSEKPGQPAVKKQKGGKDVITRQKIADMSEAEYSANRERIFQLQKEGKL